MYARYTVVLKDLLETEQTKSLINDALSDYPIYETDPDKKRSYIPNIIPTREELNQKLLNAYKYREIGFETVGRFIDELRIAMHEIMPYYNQLMFTQDQDYNIIYNVDYIRENVLNIEGESSNTVDTTSNDGETVTGTSHAAASDKTQTSANVNSYSKDVNVDTPQNTLSLPSAVSGSGDGAVAGADQLTHASEAKWGNNVASDTGSSSGESESASTSASTAQRQSIGKNEMSSKRGEAQVGTERVFGNYGQVSAQSLVEKYRELIVNIEQKIINDRRIKDLFMQVY